MTVEDRMAEEVSGPLQRLGDGIWRRSIEVINLRHRIEAEGSPDGTDVLTPGGLVTGDPDRVLVDQPHVHAALCRCRNDLIRPSRRAGGDGVEEPIVDDLNPR